MGIDSGGASLDQSMPRYQFSLEDNADLIAYLKILEHDHDPGVSDSLVRIGVLLPANDEASGRSEAIRKVLQAQVKSLNEQGGLYHRRIELVFAEALHERNLRADVVREITSGNEAVFALLATDLGGVDSRLLTIAEQEEVPLLGVIAPPASERPSPGRWCYFMLAGPDDQAFALMRQALHGARKGDSLAIIHGSEEKQRSLARSLADRCQRAGTTRPIDIEVSDAGDDLESVVRAMNSTAAIVLLAPPGRTVKTLAHLANAGRTPRVLIPSTLSDDDILSLPVEFDRRVLLALPIAPSDQSREGLARYNSLVGSNMRRERHQIAQISALALVDVLTEGLRRAERALTRERFISVLGNLRDFRSGLTPPLTFGPDRRVGAPGAHAITVDLLGRRLIPDGPWIDVDSPLLSR
jgi:ABC-type branched-subunit amino acid transport system substrate-binding protein